MQSVLLVCAAAALLQVLPSTTNAAVVKITTTNQYKFSIDHALVLTYSSVAQRDALLQRIFGLWKTVLAGNQVSGLTYKFLQEAPAIDPGTHVVQYEISGTSASEISLKEVTDSFEDALPNSGISGVVTLASLGGNAPQLVDGGQRGMISFSVDIQTFLSYRKSAERDAILQRILDLWKTTFASSQFSGLSISFVSEEPSGTAGAEKVTYRISGKSNQAVDAKALSGQFLTALESAQLDGVVGVRNINSDSGSDSGSSSPVEINDSVIMNYRTNAERDSLLQKIMNIFKTSLSTFQVMNLKIEFVREVVRADGSRTVFYKLTGQARQPMDDVQPIIEVVHTNLKNTPIRGISVVSADEADSGSATTEASSEPSADSEASNGLMSFRADLQTFLTYQNMPERDAILQQILNLWKTTFASFQLSDLRVTFISEQPAGNTGAKKVSYRISGRSSRSIDVKALIDQFLSALESAHLNGVAGVRSISTVGAMKINQGSDSGFPIEISDSLILNYRNNAERDRLLQQILNLFKTSMSSFQVMNLKIEFVREVVRNDGSKTVFYKLTGQAQQPMEDVQSTIETVHTGLKTSPIKGITIVSSGDSSSGEVSATTESSDNSDTSPSGAQVPVEINDSLLLKFKTNTERDRLLQQILNLYKSTLSSLRISNWKIQYIRDVAGSGGSRIVTYKLTGQGDMPLSDVKSNINQVHANLKTKPIEGVFVVAPADSASNPTTTESSDQPSTEAATEMPAGSDENHAVPVEINDSLLLSYSSNSQRDSLLQKILSLFKTRMSFLQLTNLKIQYIRDVAGTDGSKVVFYKITGQAQQPISDVRSVIETFHTSFKTSPIKGVSVTSDSISSSTESSEHPESETTDSNQQMVPTGLMIFRADIQSFLVYRTVAERDAILQKILDLWKTTFGSLSISDLKISFVSEQPSLTAGVKRVTYRISGKRGDNIDIKALMKQFVSVLESSRINGFRSVSSMSGGGLVMPISVTTESSDVTTENSGNADNSGGASEGSSGGSVPVELNDSLMLTFKSTAERDRLLQQILSRFQTTLSSLQVLNLKIQYIRDVAGAGGSRTVFYKITGQGQQALDDAPSIIETVHTNLKSKPIQGVSIGASAQSVDKSTATTESSDQSADSSTNDNLGKGAPVEINDSVMLTYVNSAERDRLLQQLLNFFMSTMKSVRFTNLKIQYMSDVAGSEEGSRKVTYKIFGQAQPAVKDVHAAIDQLHASLQASPIKGIMVLAAAGGSSEESSDEAAPETTTAESTDSGEEEQPPPTNAVPFQLDDMLLLMYKSTSERDILLQKILKVFRTVMAAVQFVDLKIQYVSDSAGSGGARLVSYRITGKAQPRLDAMSFYIERIHDSLTFNPINGISIPPAGGSKSVPVTTVATTEGADQSTDSGQGTGNVDNSGSGSTSGGPFDFTRKIYLAYDKMKDRSTYLARLEVIWRNSLNDFIPTNVKIIFVSDKKVGKMPKEKQGQAVHEVTYRLTGSTEKPFDVEAVSKVFQQTVFDAHLGGVSFDASGFIPDQQ